MMEAFQIVFNLAFLGVLAWWVLREKKMEVSREEWEKFTSTVEESKDLDVKLFQTIADKIVNHKEAIVELQGIVEKLQEHRATGNEIAEAIKTGAAMAQHHIDSGVKLVLDVMALEGKLPPANYEPPKEAVNLDEDEYSFAPPVTTAMPDIIMARSEKHAEQIGDKILDDLMRGIK